MYFRDLFTYTKNYMCKLYILNQNLFWYEQFSKIISKILNIYIEKKKIENS